MRLLQYDDNGELTLTKDLPDGEIPPYAILSHTWGRDEDKVTLQEVRNGVDKGKKGYRKLQLCGEQARRDKLGHFWVDTCCIDKTSSSDVSKNINLMFRYYQNSSRCYAYLSDVHSTQWKQELPESRWFRRGWTLQELLAPRDLLFFSVEWVELGSKTALGDVIHTAAKVPIDALRATDLSCFREDDRMQWISGRDTREPEDKAYCLLGIFGVSMTPRYGEGADAAFLRLKSKIQKNLTLNPHTIYRSIRNYYLRDGCLDIERISGELLPMESYFVNLEIVKKLNGNKALRTGSSRQEIQTSDALDLEALFDSRPLLQGMTARPRRIVIWGRAGMGKTTLCKKIVYDFLHNDLWQDLYDCMFWLPLRRLRLLGHEAKSVAQLIEQVCFYDTADNFLTATTLQDTLKHSGDRCLFILDGLDEISYAAEQDSPMGANLLKLMRQRNVLITSRPHGTSILQRMQPDLELETVGFFSVQIDEFLHREVQQDETLRTNVTSIQTFIQNHEVMQSLVRIPIQLDAVCYAWDQALFQDGQVTMTLLYQTISLQIWRRDVIRLSKKSDGEFITLQQVQNCDLANLRPIIEPEVSCLEELAFAGLFHQVFEFSSTHINLVAQGKVALLGSRLGKSSFLRSSGNSRPDDHLHHFMHLTFQEFFAAHYFVRHWSSHSPMKIPALYPAGRRELKNEVTIVPLRFMQENKYSARLEVFWRFVTGLIQTEIGEGALCPFFEHLESEPYDQLGFSHQRLIVRCMHEIANDPACFQAKSEALQRHLASWVVYETQLWNGRFASELLAMAECPSMTIDLCLRNAQTKTVTMASLRNKPSLVQKYAREILEEAQNSVDTKLRDYALRVMVNNSDQFLAKDQFWNLFDARDMRLWEQLHRSTPWPKQEQYLFFEQISRRMAVGKLDKVIKQHINLLIAHRELPDFVTQVLVHFLQQKNHSYHVGRTASYVLSYQKSLSSSIIEELVELFNDPDAVTRAMAARSVGNKDLPPFVTDALGNLLKDEAASVRLRAISSLSQQNTLSHTFVQSFTRLLKDDSPSVRFEAAKAHLRHGDSPELAYLALVELLAREECYYYCDIFSFLAKQRDVPEFVFDALAALLYNVESQIRARAAETVLALYHCAPLSVFKASAHLINDSDESVLITVCEALRKSNLRPLPDYVVEILMARALDLNLPLRHRIECLCPLKNAIDPDQSIAEALVDRLIEDPDIEDTFGWLMIRDYCSWITLPDAQVRRLMKLLGSEADYTVIEILGRQTDFYKLLPTLSLAQLKAVIVGWQFLNHDNHSYALLGDGVFLIEFPGKTFTTSFNKADFDLLQRNWRQASQELGMPIQPINNEESQETRRKKRVKR